MKKQTSRATHLARLVTAAALAAGLVAACGGGGGGGGGSAPVAGPAADAAPQASIAPTSAATAEPTALDAGTAVALGKSSSTGTAKTVAQPKNTEGRLLASNCFQCHGTLGTGGFDAIRGKDANEVLEFMRKPASGNIMAAHAQGYTPVQLQKIMAYLQQ